MSKFRPNLFRMKDFEQVILVFRPEWLVQSQQKLERFFQNKLGRNLDIKALIRFAK